MVRESCPGFWFLVWKNRKQSWCDGVTGEEEGVWPAWVNVAKTKMEEEGKQGKQKEESENSERDMNLGPGFQRQNIRCG